MWFPCFVSSCGPQCASACMRPLQLFSYGGKLRRTGHQRTIPDTDDTHTARRRGEADRDATERKMTTAREATDKKKAGRRRGGGADNDIRPKNKLHKQKKERPRWADGRREGETEEGSKGMSAADTSPQIMCGSISAL